MNLPELCIRRPVMTSLLMIGILIFGIFAFRLLPVSDLPNVDFPIIMVNAALPGANPETMASSVATPLERQFSTIAGLDSMSSSSTIGSTTITMQFNLNRNIDAAAQDVQAAISQCAGKLPPNLPNPPTYQKLNPADQPIIYIALTSATLPMQRLHEYADTTMAQRISTVSGVSQVLIFGPQKFAVRVQVDPAQLASRKIGIDEVAAAITSGNVNLPTGTLYGPERAYTVEASGSLADASAYRPLIIAYRNGQPVRLGEVGTVINGVEQDKAAAWFCDANSQQRAIVLAVQRQPGTNTVEVSDAVKALLPSFRSILPASVSMHIVFDRSEPIKASVHDVEFTLMLTLALVVLVIFLFLRNVFATVIPSLTLPMAIIGTFMFMYVLGYSLDNLSLMALTLSVGFVVDDAIVMLENIVRHNEMGKPIFQAALEGSREIGFTIISMTISLAAVFIPVLFMGGIVGRLFREFSVTIGVAVLVSGFVALTLTPMLTSRFLRSAKDVHHGRAYAASERIFTQSLAIYERGLRWVIDHRRGSMIFSLVILILTGVLFVKIPKGFLPSEDRSIVYAQTETIQGISHTSMMAHQQAVNSVLQKQPEIKSFLSVSNRPTLNTGIFFLHLKPRSDRDVSVDEFIEVIRPKLAQVPGIISFVQNPPSIPVGGRNTKSQYQFTIQSSDTRELYREAALLTDKLKAIAELQDVTTDMQMSNPQVNVNIAREKASSLGVSAAQIEDALYYAYGSRQVSTILTADNQYQVILELDPRYQLDPTALSMLYVRSKTGQLVPLRELATLSMGVGPLTVNHSGQLPSVTISFNTKPGVSLGMAVDKVKEIARQTLGATMVTSFQGTAAAFQTSMAGLGLLLVAAILVIYLVLGILYESFIHPLTILSALPFAGFGALLTLLIFNTDLSLYAFVGIIMLVGLVKKNGIMMIDFAIEAQRKEGKSAHDAIIEACLIRFRPIMMTTMAALMAGIPIAAGFGAGAEARRPLGLAVVGGLLFSQTLTLFITPVFYIYMEQLRVRMARKFHVQGDGMITAKDTKSTKGE